MEEWRGSTDDLKFLKSGDDVSSSVLTTVCREWLDSNDDDDDDDARGGGGGEFITSDHIGISSTMGLCVAMLKGTEEYGNVMESQSLFI